MHKCGFACCHVGLVFNSRVVGTGMLLFFTATWCKPCKDIYPVVDDLCKTTDAFFVKVALQDIWLPELIGGQVDVDELDEVAAKFKIAAMPTFVALKNGKEVFILAGLWCS